jgi:hypothetical protein
MKSGNKKVVTCLLIRRRFAETVIEGRVKLILNAEFGVLMI